MKKFLFLFLLLPLALTAQTYQRVWTNQIMGKSNDYVEAMSPFRYSLGIDSGLFDRNTLVPKGWVLDQLLGIGIKLPVSLDNGYFQLALDEGSTFFNWSKAGVRIGASNEDYFSVSGTGINFCKPPTYTSDWRASYTDRTVPDWGNVNNAIQTALNNYTGGSKWTTTPNGISYSGSIFPGAIKKWDAVTDTFLFINSIPSTKTAFVARTNSGFFNNITNNYGTGLYIDINYSGGKVIDVRDLRNNSTLINVTGNTVGTYIVKLPTNNFAYGLYTDNNQGFLIYAGTNTSYLLRTDANSSNSGAFYIGSNSSGAVGFSLMNNASGAYGFRNSDNYGTYSKIMRNNSGGVGYTIDENYTNATGYQVVQNNNIGYKISTNATNSWGFFVDTNGSNAASFRTTTNNGYSHYVHINNISGTGSSVYLNSGIGYNVELNQESTSVAYNVSSNAGVGYRIITNSGTGFKVDGPGKHIRMKSTGNDTTEVFTQTSSGLNQVFKKNTTTVWRVDGDGVLMQAQLTCDITDNSPTQTELVTCLGSASTQGAGTTRNIKDSSDNSIYQVLSNGSNWGYVKFTIP